MLSRGLHVVRTCHLTRVASYQREAGHPPDSDAPVARGPGFDSALLRHYVANVCCLLRYVSMSEIQRVADLADRLASRILDSVEGARSAPMSYGKTPTLL